MQIAVPSELTSSLIAKKTLNMTKERNEEEEGELLPAIRSPEGLVDKGGRQDFRANNWLSLEGLPIFLLSNGVVPEH